MDGENFFVVSKGDNFFFSMIYCVWEGKNGKTKIKKNFFK